MRTLALGPIRHACHACGHCCTGWRVKVADSERERILRHGASLGVADPIVDGTLRTDAGRCVFLDDARRCRIHAAFGPTEKPGVCQVFPRVAIATEDAIRIGADPGCSSTWRSFVDGTLIEFPIARSPRKIVRSPEVAATELDLIGLVRHHDMTVARLVAILCDDQRHLPDLPPGFLTRLLSRMQDLDFFLTHPEAGPLLTGDLAAVATLLRELDPHHPPPVAFTADTSALTLETIARTLFLRLGDDVLAPAGQLLLVLAGAIASAAAHPDLARFGPALAAWSRLSRLPGFWTPFIPDEATARHILSGG